MIIFDNVIKTEQANPYKFNFL